MSILPQDLVLKIGSELSLPFLGIFVQVCKHFWNSIDSTDDIPFWKEYCGTHLGGKEPKKGMTWKMHVTKFFKFYVKARTDTSGAMVAAVANGLSAFVDYVIVTYKLDMTNPSIIDKHVHPLYQATASSDYATMEVLLHHGCDPNYVGIKSESPIQRASKKGDTMAFFYLKKDGPVDFELFNQAIQRGNQKLALKMLARGVNDLTKIHKQRNVLQEALSKRLVDVVAELLKTGQFSASLVDSRGWPLICSAVSLGNIQIIELLLQHKATVKEVDPKGATPLMIAIREQKELDLIELLLSRGSDPNVVGLHSETPFTIAVKTANLPIIKKLYSIVDNPLTKRLNDSTIFHMCSTNVPVLQFFVSELEKHPQHKSLLTMRDEHGCLALETAVGVIMNSDDLSFDDGVIKINEIKGVLGQTLVGGSGVLITDVVYLSSNNKKYLKNWYDWLFAEGVDINLMHVDRTLPLVAAARYNKALVSDLLSKNANHNEFILVDLVIGPQHYSDKSNYVANIPELIDVFVKKGVKVNTEDADGYSPLLCAFATSACWAQGPKIVDHLVSLGALVTRDYFYTRAFCYSHEGQDLPTFFRLVYTYKFPVPPNTLQQILDQDYSIKHGDSNNVLISLLSVGVDVKLTLSTNETIIEFLQQQDWAKGIVMDAVLDISVARKYVEEKGWHKFSYK